MAIIFVDDEVEKKDDEYEIGDTFLYNGNIPCILILTHDNMVAMISLNDKGFTWNGSIVVEDYYSITAEEFDKICGGNSELFERVDLEIRVKR